MAEIRTDRENIGIPTAFIEDLYATIPGRGNKVLKIKGNLKKY